jgi:hypothetical protein
MRRRSTSPLIAIAALLLASCGGGGGTTVIKKTVTEQAPAQPSTTTAQSTSTTTETTAPGSAAPARKLTAFQLPSRNIGCYISTQFGGNARCDIRDRTWQPPPKPANCELDWGQGVAFHGNRRAGVVCAGDTTLNQGPVLSYGQRSQSGPIVCQSRQAGVTCTNTGSSHGFFLSRQSYRLF